MNDPQLNDLITENGRHVVALLLRNPNATIHHARSADGRIADWADRIDTVREALHHAGAIRASRLQPPRFEDDSGPDATYELTALGSAWGRELHL